MAEYGEGYDWEALKQQYALGMAQVAAQQASVAVQQWRAQNIDLPLSQAQIKQIEASIYQQAWERTFQEQSQKFSQMLSMAGLTGFIDQGMLGGGTTTGNLNSALDYIWTKRPDLAQFYQANGWDVSTEEGRRKATQDWLGMTTEENVRAANGDASTFAQSLGWSAPQATSGSSTPQATLAYQQWYANQFGKQYGTDTPTFEREQWNADTTGYTADGKPTQEREQFYSNLLGSLSGPRDWAKYQSVLRGVENTGDLGKNQMAWFKQERPAAFSGMQGDTGGSWQQMLDEYMRSKGLRQGDNVGVQGTPFTGK
jgi:hypothetical protein